MSDGSPTLVAALKYIARGWPVLPLSWPLTCGAHARCSCQRPSCAKVGKHPHGLLVPHGVSDATTEPEIARQWWGRFPRANVGIALGERAGMFVLDIDPRTHGDRTLIELLLEHGGLGGTLEAVTGSGGSHYFFAWPSRRVANVTGGLGPGVDVKGDGGYVVAAPSIHASGRRYFWPYKDRASVPPTLAAPRWVIERVIARADRLAPPRPLASTRPTTTGEGLDVVTRASAYVAKMDAAVSGSGGHLTTMRVALALVRGFALDTETALQLLREYNDRCQPRWSERELQHKIASAERSAVRSGYLLEAQRA